MEKNVFILQLALVQSFLSKHYASSPIFRRFTLKCMTPKCIARVVRAKTPSADTALPAASLEPEDVVILTRKPLHFYRHTPITLDPFLNCPHLKLHLLGHPLLPLHPPLHPLPILSVT